MLTRDGRHSSAVISYAQTSIVIQVVCPGLYFCACSLHLRRVSITGFRWFVVLIRVLGADDGRGNYTGVCTAKVEHFLAGPCKNAVSLMRGLKAESRSGRHCRVVQ